MYVSVRVCVCVSAYLSNAYRTQRYSGGTYTFIRHGFTVHYILYYTTHALQIRNKVNTAGFKVLYLDRVRVLHGSMARVRSTRIAFYGARTNVHVCDDDVSV